MVAEAFIADYEEPVTYEEAIHAKQSANWRKAMNSEMTSLIENETWTLEELPNYVNVIPCKRVYKVKKNSEDSVDKFKTRLVAKRLTQQFGVDYEQTFSPVTKLGTVRSILSIAADEKMHLIPFGVCSTFLYGTQDELTTITTRF